MRKLDLQPNARSSVQRLRKNATEQKKRAQRRRQSQQRVFFPEARLHRLMRTMTEIRVAQKAAVFVAAVLDYLTAELLDVSHILKTAEKTPKKFLTTRHLYLAVQYDAEMDQVLGHNIVWHNGGAIPHIHAALLRRPARKKRAGIQRKRKQKTASKPRSK